MNIINLNREWNFVAKEIVTSNKSGAGNGMLLFEFQSLLSILSRIKNPREKQMLSSIYQERKRQYKNISSKKLKTNRNWQKNVYSSLRISKNQKEQKTYGILR